MPDLQPSNGNGNGDHGDERRRRRTRGPRRASAACASSPSELEGDRLGVRDRRRVTGGCSTSRASCAQLLYETDPERIGVRPPHARDALRPRLQDGHAGAPHALARAQRAVHAARRPEAASSGCADVLPPEHADAARDARAAPRAVALGVGRSSSTATSSPAGCTTSASAWSTSTATSSATSCSTGRACPASVLGLLTRGDARDVRAHGRADRAGPPPGRRAVRRPRGLRRAVAAAAERGLLRADPRAGHRDRRRRRRAPRPDRQAHRRRRDRVLPGRRARLALGAPRAPRSRSRSEIAAIAERIAAGGRAGRLLEAGGWRFNTGVHWGSTLYIGQIATGGRLEVAALGDEFNEALRIQQSARGGVTLASKALLERLDAEDADGARPRRRSG